MNGPRILFFGYSEVGHDCLELLLRRGDHVIGLITHEDSPGENIWFKTPALLAREHCVPVFTPKSVNTPEWEERIAAMRPDLILSVYYRQMIRDEILRLAPLGAFNIHGSLLPEYRGRAPVNWAVLHGEPRIGMTLHRMVKRPDAGEIIDQQGVDIGPDDTAEQAFRKVLPCAVEVLARQIARLLDGSATGTPQDDSLATYYGGRTPEDGRIDWSASARRIHDLVRAVTDPYPGAFTDLGASRLMVWQTALVAAPSGSPGEILSLEPLVVATGDGALQLLRTEWRGPPPPALVAGDIL